MAWYRCRCRRFKSWDRNGKQNFTTVNIAHLEAKHLRGRCKGKGFLAVDGEWSDTREQGTNFLNNLIRPGIRLNQIWPVQCSHIDMCAAEIDNSVVCRCSNSYK